MTGCFVSRKLFLAVKWMHAVRLCWDVEVCQLSYTELQQTF